MTLRNFIGVLALFSLLTPVWYLPVRMAMCRRGWFKKQSGRVRKPNLIDWLNATGIGWFIAANIAVVAKFYFTI